MRACSVSALLFFVLRCLLARAEGCELAEGAVFDWVGGKATNFAQFRVLSAAFPQRAPPRTARRGWRDAETMHDALQSMQSVQSSSAGGLLHRRLCVSACETRRDETRVLRRLHAGQITPAVCARQAKAVTLSDPRTPALLAFSPSFLDLAMLSKQCAMRSLEICPVSSAWEAQRRAQAAEPVCQIAKPPRRPFRDCTKLLLTEAARCAPCSPCRCPAPQSRPDNATMTLPH